jgi:hypothetical protein
MRRCSMALYIPSARQRVFISIISFLDREGRSLHELIVSIAKSGLFVYHLFR